MTEPIDSFEELPGLEPSDSEVHLSDHWAVVVKYRRLVIACVATALVVGALWTFLATPMYRANIVLDIVRQSSNPVGLAGSVPIVGILDFLPSQIELLQSRDVAERVVRKLNLLSNPEFLAAHPELEPDAPATSSPGKKTAPRQPSPREISRAAGAVREDADAVIVKTTSLVRVSYESPSRRLAADVANAMADAYIEWNIESRFRQIAQSAQFLATQIEQAKRDIDEKEKALLIYARQKDILAVDTKTNPSGERLGAFNDDYAVAVADRVAKEARYQELQRTSAETVAESAAGGIFAQLKADQSRLERDYADKLALYKPEWPAMQQLKKQVEEGNVRIATAIRDTANKVREAARSEYLTALRRETSMQSMMRLKQSEALNQTANSSEYNNLRVEIDTKRALLDTLLREQGEAEVLSRLREEQVTNIRIVDRALRPNRPFSPSIPKNMAIALVLGSGLGLGLAFLLSYLDRTLQSGEQVERFLQLPALGAIPLVGNVRKMRGARKRRDAETTSGDPARTAGVELMPHQVPRSALAEAYRAFRTSLLFSRAGGVKLVAITSVLPQEGKTATAVNLAVVLAQLGRRVLVVDADLHRSRVHEMFGVSNQAGLVSILAEGMEPSRVIVKTSVPGVFVVPAGPETPNPSALLSSEDMRQFLELAAANFDHVVIDTPPVLATSDVLVFGQHTDGVVLCVRAGVTPRDQVKRVRDKLLRGGIPILGVLLNGRKLDADYYEYRYLNYGEKPGTIKGSESKEPLGRGEQEAPPGRGVISGA
jgi:succinoglycan biosynthesis transport protein ExoP